MVRCEVDSACGLNDPAHVVLGLADDADEEVELKRKWPRDWRTSQCKI